MARCFAAAGIILVTMGGLAINSQVTAERVTPPANRDLTEVERLAAEVARLKSRITELVAAIKRLQETRIITEPAADGDAAAPTMAEAAETTGGPFYTVAPQEKFREMVEDIQRRIRVLNARGDVEEAAKMAEKLAFFVTQAKGDYSATSEAPEIHVVGIHEPNGRNGRKAPIRVSYTGAPIILVLTAYNPADWQVTTDDGVRLQEVIATGYHLQKVSAAPEDTSVTIHSREAGDQQGRNC